MRIYSLTQVSNTKEMGCYGVFSSVDRATQCAIEFAKDNGEEYSAETVWDGFTKKIYCGDYEFEIWRHTLDCLP